MADEVRVLFGPGGSLRLVTFGRNGKDAGVIDCTFCAEELVAAGLRLARAVPMPREVTGSVEIDLGDGGRVMWIEGGGDITADDASQAVAAAVEQLDVDALVEIFRRGAGRVRAAEIESIEGKLVQVGLTRRQVAAMLSRRRKQFDGRSIRTVLMEADAKTDEVDAAFTLLFEPLGIEQHKALLALLTPPPARTASDRTMV
jgi:hypothetical protein